MSVGETMRSTSPNLEDVELGSSAKGNARTRPMMKAKDSNIVELQPLVVDTSSKAKSSHSFTKSIVASTLYSGCSIGMVLVNKSLASSYNHLIEGDLNILLVVFQAIAAVICVEFSKFMGWVEYPNFNTQTARLWAPVNLFFCGMLFTGMASMQHNSVPMVTVFKNITNIMTTIGDCILYGAGIEVLVMAAFGIMLLGAIFAARNDADVTQTGLFWMLGNCLCTSGYVLYLKYATKTVKLSKFGMVFYNNVLCSLFLLPVTMFNGELSTFLGTSALHTVDYMTKNAFAGFVGFFLNFASLNCVAQTGPTTYAMIGSLNKIPITIFGFLIFEDDISPETWKFIWVSLCGGILYTVAKLRTGRRSKGEHEDEEPPRPIGRQQGRTTPSLDQQPLATMIIKTIGMAVVGLAVLIGSIGKFAPHLFFNLPFPLSVILWVTTGHGMPMYFMDDAWKEDEIDTWMKDGDLVVAAGAKSGTTFMLYCTHQIRTKGTDLNDDLFPDVSISTPWPDLRQSRAGTWAEQKDRYNDTVLANGRKLKDYWDNPKYPFRIFKSHYAPPELPVRKKGGKKIKYLAMARNGIDVAASMTNFYSAHTDKFRTIWGGFPPDISGDDHAADEPPAAVKDMLPTGPMRELYFGYVKKWWDFRNDPNVLYLHYADVRKDLKGHVSKVAKFLDVDLNEDELDVVTKRCSMEHMKSLDGNKFGYTMPLSQDKNLWDAQNDKIIKNGEILRTGEIGKGKTKFHPSVVEQWEKAEEDEFGHDPSLLHWARNGGEF